MKLRNKKTGEIFDALIREKGGGNKYSIIVCDIEKYSEPPLTRCVLGEYHSLAKLNEEWEDYKPTEPIIGDPKIRKVVRAWAEANDVHNVVIVNSGTLRCKQKGIDIEFNGSPFYGWMSATKTITELCG